MERVLKPEKPSPVKIPAVNNRENTLFDTTLVSMYASSVTSQTSVLLLSNGSVHNGAMPI